MKVEFVYERDNIRAMLFGDMDEYGVRQIRDEVDFAIENATGLRALTLDLKGVTFIDSTGLGFVFGRYKRLRARRAELLLANVNEQVDKVFRTSGVYRFAPIVE